MNSLSIKTNLIIFVTFLLMFTCGISIFSLQRIAKTSRVIIDLMQIKTDILTANIAIRNAAIANSEHKRESELTKMLVTRESANAIYDRLTHELDGVDATILSEMKKERVEYRQKQIEVVELILSNVDDSRVWSNLMYYQTLMDRYIKRVETIQKNINETSRDYYNTSRYIIVFSFLVSVLLCYLVLFNISIRRN